MENEISNQENLKGKGNFPLQQNKVESNTDVPDAQKLNSERVKQDISKNKNLGDKNVKTSIDKKPSVSKNPPQKPNLTPQSGQGNVVTPPVSKNQSTIHSHDSHTAISEFHLKVPKMEEVLTFIAEKKGASVKSYRSKVDTNIFDINMRVERLFKNTNKEITIKIVAVLPSGVVKKIIFEDNKNVPVTFLNTDKAINYLEEILSDE